MENGHVSGFLLNVIILHFCEGRDFSKLCSRLSLSFVRNVKLDVERIISDVENVFTKN